MNMHCINHRNKMQTEEAIFRKVQHEYYIEDARDHTEEFNEFYNSPYEWTEKDLNNLASLFEKKKDCNAPDNNTWQSLILEYAKEHNIEMYE